MRTTHIHPTFTRWHVGLMAILAMTVSFGLGLKTSGELRTIDYSSATEDIRAGDMNEDGIINNEDVAIILEIAQGYRPATPAELSHDPNGDGRLTVDDAMRLLHDL